MKEIIRGREVKRRILKQGDSHMVTTPPEILQKLMMRAGDHVTITSTDDSVTYRKHRAPGGDTCKSE